MLSESAVAAGVRFETAPPGASGIVAAVVFPYRSRLITTFDSGSPSRSAAASMMRRLAWCDTNRSTCDGAIAPGGSEVT